MFPIVLSHLQTRLALSFRGTTGKIALSPDLGLTTVEVTVEAEGLLFPEGERVSWESIREINSAENNCFVIRKGRPEKILAYSSTTQRVCSLMPADGAPTLLVAGFTMHRIENCNPWQDTLNKIGAVAPIHGRVLDTATGLGYTAIEAARTATQVHTIELDPATQEIAQLNPYSRDLFDHPRIVRHIGDSYELVDTFAPGVFDRIIHDPPTMSLGGRLYSREFYRKLHLLLAPKGRMYHYIGNPASRSIRNATRGIAQRLREAGFSEIRPHPRSFGLVAFG